MALTLKAEQRLIAVGLDKFFEEHKTEWKNAAKQARDFLKHNFPANSTIRPDDVASVLAPILDVNKKLTDKLSVKKLTEKYWKTYFTDLIIDRVWSEIT